MVLSNTSILLFNTTLIIAFVFLMLKFHNYLLGKFHTKLVVLLFPLIFSMLSVFVMFFPIIIDGIRIDLRSIPLFVISFVGGLKLGLIAAVLPSLARIYLGGPTVLEGILTGILWVIFVGAIFHKKREFKPPYATINKKRIVNAFLLCEISQNMYLNLVLTVSLDVLVIKGVISITALLITIWLINDIHQAEKMTLELEYLSSIDQMTQLMNVASFKKKIDYFLKKNSIYHIVMVDVDYFKQYNDRHGHPAGDVVLKEVATILKENIRKEDLVARYGGEEFILGIKGLCIEEELHSFIERIRVAVEHYPFQGRDTQPGGKITISIGVSGCNKESNLESQIRDADAALYVSKKRGRNVISFFNERTRIS